MQQVFIARDLAFERDVALKVAKNVSAEKRFDRSARMSARVTHPNVAKTSTISKRRAVGISSKS
jgi:serine/threonine-protein kinase